MNEPYLYKIEIKNFKSIKEQIIDLSNFNVLVGANGSGKTNILEVFKFLKMINLPSVPYNPTYPWWGYKNIVYLGNSSEPIYFKLYFQYDEIKFSYSITVDDQSGNVGILEEKFSIDSILTLTKIQKKVSIEYNESFLSKNISAIKNKLKDVKFPNFDINTVHFNGKFHPAIVNRLFSQSNIVFGPGYSGSFLNIESESGNLTVQIYQIQDPIQPMNQPESYLIVFPTIKTLDENPSPFIRGLDIFENIIQSYISNNVFIHNISFAEIKKAVFPKKSLLLEEDASNVAEILYNWFIRNGGKLPERITLALKRLFPNIQLRFTLTEDGRIYLIVKEDDYELMPPSQPDGLLKLLVILVSLELPSRIVLIDELENTLHANILRYIIDELKNETEKTIIITTHSSTIVDQVKIEDILLVEKDKKTTIKKVEEPEKLRKRLQELGITNSESWLAGTMAEFN